MVEAAVGNEPVGVGVGAVGGGVGGDLGVGEDRGGGGGGHDLFCWQRICGGVVGSAALCRAGLWWIGKVACFNGRYVWLGALVGV
jgi:hypothetical protein